MLLLNNDTVVHEDSFSPLIAYGYYDGPIANIFVRDDTKWCFNCADHGGIGNTSNGGDGTVTLTIRLADKAQLRCRIK